MKNYTYLFLFSLLFLACRESSTKTELKPLSLLEMGTSTQTMIIDNKLPSFPMNKEGATVITVPEPKEFLVRDVVKNYSFIALETTDEGIIGQIDRLCMDSTFLFILDRKYNAVFSFDNKGRFLRRIGSKGRGPKEYISADRITVDTVRKELCVVDRDGWKILYYSYMGEHLRSIPMYFIISDFEFFGDGFITVPMRGQSVDFPALDKKEVIICDKKYKPIYTLFDELKDLSPEFSGVPTEPMKPFYDGIYYSTLLSDTIWRINQTSCDAVFVLNYPNRKKDFLTRDLRNLTTSVFSKLTYEEDFSYGDYLVSPDFAYFLILSKKIKKMYTLIYNRKTKHIYYGRPHLWDKKQLVDHFFTSFRAVGDDGKFISILQPYDILSTVDFCITGEKYDKLSDSDKAFLKTLKEEDNPVLMIMELKNF